MIYLFEFIAMIVLGICSAVLTYFNRNLYVRAFDDILGAEEDERVSARLGRSFVYGFLFPVYFALFLAGLITLIAFLIVAGIIAAIVFALVWITEKLIPHDWLGSLIKDLFNKVGVRGAETGAAAMPASEKPEAAPIQGPPPLESKPSEEKGPEIGIEPPGQPQPIEEEAKDETTPEAAPSEQPASASPAVSESGADKAEGQPEDPGKKPPQQ